MQHLQCFCSNFATYIFPQLIYPFHKKYLGSLWMLPHSQSKGINYRKIILEDNLSILSKVEDVLPSTFHILVNTTSLDSLTPMHCHVQWMYKSVCYSDHRWRRPNCPSGVWLNKLRFSHIIELHLAIKMNWLDLRMLTPNKM